MPLERVRNSSNRERALACCFGAHFKLKTGAHFCECALADQKISPHRFGDQEASVKSRMGQLSGSICAEEIRLIGMPGMTRGTGLLPDTGTRILNEVAYVMIAR